MGEGNFLIRSFLPPYFHPSKTFVDARLPLVPEAARKLGRPYELTDKK